MEAGEREIRKAFENVTLNNIKATVEHSNESRKLIRELSEKIVSLERRLIQTNQSIDDLKKLVVNMQMRVFIGGTA